MPGERSSRYGDVAPRSPWIAQLELDGPPRPLDRDVTCDVVIVGAGIAGIATAFWTLRDTSLSVLVVERDRVGRGATGRNAGQLTTYFERPLTSIAAEYGEALACDAQADIDGAHDLLDVMARECQCSVRVERFVGHMGMFSLEQIVVHLGNNALRKRHGLPTDPCVISEDAAWLDEVPDEFSDLYAVVPQMRICELLETDDDRYRAVLSERKGCANSGLLVQQVLSFLEKQYPDRLRYVDMTFVDRVEAGSDEVVVSANGQRVRASQVVLCTNGFDDHVVVDGAAEPVLLANDQRVVGTIGYMAAFVEETPRLPTAMSYIRNVEIGDGDTPYFYVTRRTYDRSDDVVTLTCMGGPEWPIEGPWERDLPFAGALLDHMDEHIRPFAQPRRPPGLPYDFAWHGLMGYSQGLIRVVGRHPTHPKVLYNFGCNGIGFLPSIYGGHRVAKLLAGRDVPPSIFDPRSPLASR
jgi:glycine/D-amino acid oxidase-like deaminating enzyme